MFSPIHVYVIILACLEVKYTHVFGLDFVDGESSSFIMFSSLLIIRFKHDLSIVCLFFSVTFAPLNEVYHCSDH